MSLHFFKQNVMFLIINSLALSKSKDSCVFSISFSPFYPGTSLCAGYALIITNILEFLYM